MKLPREISGEELSKLFGEVQGRVYANCAYSRSIQRAAEGGVYT